MKEFNWYAYATDKKDLRRVLQGIYCHEGKFIVSNAHIMIGKNYSYPEKYEGKIVLPDGSFVTMKNDEGVEIDAKYPKFKDILVSFRRHTKDSEKVSIDFKRFDEIRKEIGKGKKEQSKWFVKVGNVYYKYMQFKLYVDFCKFCGVDYIVQNGRANGGFEEEDCFCQIMPCISIDELYVKAM